MNKIQLVQLAFCATLWLGVGGLRAHDHWPDSESRKRIVRLDGQWKFSVGDGAERAAASYDDESWATIHVPDTWQDGGYRDYNGYAWYRKTFTVPDGAEQRGLSLSLGKIDDVDEVFVNGQRIGGTGRFPPNYASAYDVERIYTVSPAILRPGKRNVIAVRVYDGGGVGGIVRGRVGLYSGLAPQIEIQLEGDWKFSPGNNPDWKQPAFDDSGFSSISVPACWENVGYPNLDGYAWYRKTFTVAHNPAGETLVLLLGKVDDYDVVYLNGVEIGRTGPVDHPGSRGDERSYALNRAYYFPASLLKESNTIAVRVYDAGGYGGIYAGPVGIVSQAAFANYWDARRHRRIDTLFDLFRSED